MIISNENRLAFAFNSRLADFSFEKEDRVIAALDVRDGLSVPVSLRAHDQQLHLEAPVPFSIGGEATWAAYEDFAARGEEFFGLWIDPVDGETKHVAFLREATVEELNAALARTAACLDACWEDLERYAALNEVEEEGDCEEASCDAGGDGAEEEEGDGGFGNPFSLGAAPSLLEDVDGMSFGDFIAALARRSG